MKIGYSRCSATGQNHQSQIDTLEHVDCERIFQETANGSRNDREELTRLIEFARAGDAIVVRLDRLGRNIRHRRIMPFEPLVEFNPRNPRIVDTVYRGKVTGGRNFQ